MIYCQGTFGFGSELMQHLKSSELTLKEQIYKFSNTAFFCLASALESRVLQIPSDPESRKKMMDVRRGKIVSLSIASSTFWGTQVK